MKFVVDNYTHQYTLVLKNDKKFQFFYDEEEIPQENIIKSENEDRLKMGHTIFRNIGTIGIDVWQSRSGSIFDNFIICNKLEDAR